MTEERIFVALGSNLGNRALNLERAVEALGQLPEVKVVGRSTAYENPAVLAAGDSTPQPDFINAVVELRSSLEPRVLLNELKQLERRLGRVEAKRWAAREIDLDIVLWGERVIETKGISLPHPSMARRIFVLKPLSELAAEVVHPLLGLTVAELLARLEHA